jgi:hypothetical protein
MFNHYLIFFDFSLIVSPFTKMPFPLYGSGTLQARIFAANESTTSFSGPSSKMRVGCGTVALTCLGTGSSIGCEYPTFKDTNCWPSNSGSTVVAVFSTVALYPTPTSLRIAECPSDTPRIWFCRYARVVPNCCKYRERRWLPGTNLTPHLPLLLHLSVFHSHDRSSSSSVMIYFHKRWYGIG